MTYKAAGTHSGLPSGDVARSKPGGGNAVLAAARVDGWGRGAAEGRGCGPREAPRAPGLRGGAGPAQGAQGSRRARRRASGPQPAELPSAQRGPRPPGPSAARRTGEHICGVAGFQAGHPSSACTLTRRSSPTRRPRPFQERALAAAQASAQGDSPDSSVNFASSLALFSCFLLIQKKQRPAVPSTPTLALAGPSLWFGRRSSWACLGGGGREGDAQGPHGAQPATAHPQPTPASVSPPGTLV